MKKISAILFLLSVLFSGMSITYSVHYCQGDFFASKLSLTGKSATCGMDQGKSKNKDIQFSNLMCENKISKYSIFGTYIFFKNQENIRHSLHFELPSLFTLKTLTPISLEETNQLPPGSPKLLKNVINFLCVFRI